MQQLRLVVLCKHWTPSPAHGRGSCQLKLIAKDSLIGMCSACGQFELEGREQLVIAPKAEPPAARPAELDKPSYSAGLEYAKVEAGNALYGEASEADQKQRKAICGGCVHRAASYHGETDPAGFGWCTKCGCGSNPRALLENKIKMPMTECPLKLWGKVEGTGATVQTVWDTVKGVGQSVKHLLTGNSDTKKPPL